MTILVTLAQAQGPMRCVELWQHIGRKYPGCLTSLDARGLICKWGKAHREAYVALNPLHPAAEPLRELLLVVAGAYGFASPPKSTHSVEIPSHVWEPKNARSTFGDYLRTLPLLAVFVRGHITIVEVARCVAVVSRDAISQILWMYEAFGILRVERVSGKQLFSFNSEHVLTAPLQAVLKEIDLVIPHLRVVAEAQIDHKVAIRHEPRTRRKLKRWKW